MVPLRLVPPPPWTDGPEEAPHRTYEVGDCWYASPHPDGGWCAFNDGPEWSRHRVTVAPEHLRSGVRPMMVVVSDRHPPWCLHAGTTTDGSGWEVKGDLPEVTVAPSIHIHGIWHGLVRRGKLLTV